MALRRPLIIDSGSMKQIQAGDLLDPDFINTMIRDSITGARLSWVSASQVSIGTVGKVSAVRDSSNFKNIVWTGLLTADITVTGENGRDGGVEAPNTWYYVYVIMKADGTIAALLSSNGTTPTLPSGYVYYRRVGVVRNNAASDFIKFRQTGDCRARWYYYYDTVRANVQVLTDGTAITWTTVSLGAFVPPTSTLVSLAISYLTNGNTSYLALRSTGSGVAIAESIMRISPGLKVSPNYSAFTVIMPVSDSQQIDYAQTTNGDKVSLFVAGFEDVA